MEEKSLRPPIVSVLGHVDHGKTTLLDAIRKSDVASHEAGGITQSIGASQIETKQGKITFIDTPGHAIFSGMRERGVKLADIALLVVASDDGVMPQTEEALSYLKNSKTPFIVVFTKTDLPSSNIEKAKTQLEEREVFFEGRGGDTPFVVTSVKKGILSGIDELVEMIYLFSEVNEIKGESAGELNGVVVETNKDNRGILVSIVVKSGALRVGQEILAGGVRAKVRGLFDSTNKSIKEILPGQPGVILGFTELPEVGGVVLESSSKVQKESVSFSDKNQEVGEGEIAFVLKARTAGSLEAIKASLPKVAIVLHSSVGDVTESDIFFAKSVSARILVFESKVSGSVKKLADTEGVKIETFRIVYELLTYVTDLIESGQEVIKGKAEVLNVFPFNNKKVAGCRILMGEIKRGEELILMRGEGEVGKVKVISMRKQKNDIEKALPGEECGIIFVPNLDFEVGDVLVSVVKK